MLPSVTMLLEEMKFEKSTDGLLYQMQNDFDLPGTTLGRLDANRLTAYKTPSVDDHHDADAPCPGGAKNVNSEVEGGDQAVGGETIYFRYIAIG